MKLTIGQNIRTLRRADDMTQEDLENKLGVTYQSVSRWENGGTYPDMELLPAIADIFSVTVDHLLEHDKSAMEKHFNDLCARFKTAVAERNHGTVVEILRELRRDLRRYTDVLRLQDISIEIRKYRNEAPPEVIEEFRQYLEAVTLVIPEERGWTIRALAVIEDDEHLEEFLTKNSSHVDLTTDALLKERYQWRREEEDAAYMNQMNLYT
ncbi:MAG: helix-turn-helix transcriptional regulator, partial [Clostridia bacterium]|nr:helix-turn-helix transcriptional regulator [Clostridia bacterium]